MRWVGLVTGLAILGAIPAMAQQTTTIPRTQTQTAQTNQRPIDHGPYTREANKAYMGGGVILQGPPGAPAPPPSALPQIQQNAVPAQ